MDNQLREYHFTDEQIDFLMRIVRNNAQFEDDDEDKEFMEELANQIEDQIVNHPDNDWTMQITLDFELTLTDFADIVDAAGYAIGYWCDEAEYDEPYDENDPDATYTVSCEEGTEIYTLSKSDVEKAMVSIAENRVDVSNNIRDYIKLAIKEDDMCHIDGYAADAIIQVACFGTIIYG